MVPQDLWVSGQPELQLQPYLPQTMRYHALVTDYDCTIAEYGRVQKDTIDALEKVRASGRRLVLVTGRLLDDLLGIFDAIDVFDRVVAENGAVLYSPVKKQQRLLCE